MSRVSDNLTYLRDVLVAVGSGLPFVAASVSDLDDILAQLKQAPGGAGHREGGPGDFRDVADRVIQRLVELREQAHAVVSCGVTAPQTELPSPELEARLRELALESYKLRAATRESEAVLRRSRRLAEAGKLAAFVAHRFGNILHAIRGRSELLRGGPLGAAPAAVAHFATIEQACTRGTKVVEALKNYAKPREPKFGTLRIEELLSDVRGFIDSLFSDALHLRLDLAPHLPPVVADYDMLHEVIVNLALNAVDAMGQRGVLTLSAQPITRTEHGAGPPAPAGTAVKIEVRDTGPGIAPEVLPYLFQPYVTTKPDKGTGLGLLIAKKHVTGHSGTITGRNLPEGGACFTIILPVNPRIESAEPGHDQDRTT